MQCQRVVLALLLMLSVSPLMAADGAPGRGLKEIPDPELNLMRGRYTVGGNNVAWFGVTMISQWQGPNGAVVQGALTLGMDFRNGGTPKLSFQPSVHVTAADAPLPTTAGRSIDSTGLANASGLVQSVQVAGDGNTARNVTTLTVRDGAVPTTTDDGNRIAQMQQGGPPRKDLRIEPRHPHQYREQRHHLPVIARQRMQIAGITLDRCQGALAPGASATGL
mgnify:CR=1 FL=1